MTYQIAKNAKITGAGSSYLLVPLTQPQEYKNEQSVAWYLPAFNSGFLALISSSL
jgi:hypothetical protein